MKNTRTKDSSFTFPKSNTKPPTEKRITLTLKPESEEVPPITATNTEQTESLLNIKKNSFKEKGKKLFALNINAINDERTIGGEQGTQI